MIISTLHRFIFVAIPKTGTHSVRQALREQMGPEDMEHVGLFVQKKFPFPELARFRHGHFALQQVRPHLAPNDYAAFFKFAFVRNPYDRFVSFCSFYTRETGDFERNPKAVMHHFIDNPPRNPILLQPQHPFVTGPDGRLLTDYLGRVERLQECYDEIAERIGIPTQTLDRVNASRRGSYRHYYDEELIERVGRLYATDLELFGYEF